MPSGGGIHAINRAAARHKGVPLVEVCAEFVVNLRTGQRMIRGLEAAFPSVEFSTDQDRWRWWKLSDTRTLGMQGIRDGELEALEMSHSPRPTRRGHQACGVALLYAVPALLLER